MAFLWSVKHWICSTLNSDLSFSVCLSVTITFFTILCKHGWSNPWIHYSDVSRRDCGENALSLSHMCFLNLEPHPLETGGFVIFTATVEGNHQLNGLWLPHFPPGPPISCMARRASRDRAFYKSQQKVSKYPMLYQSTGSSGKGYLVCWYE